MHTKVNVSPGARVNAICGGADLRHGTGGFVRLGGLHRWRGLCVCVCVCVCACVCVNVYTCVSEQIELSSKQP